MDYLAATWAQNLCHNFGCLSIYHHRAALACQCVNKCAIKLGQRWIGGWALLPASVLIRDAVRSLISHRNDNTITADKSVWVLLSINCLYMFMGAQVYRRVDFGNYLLFNRAHLTWVRRTCFSCVCVCIPTSWAWSRRRLINRQPRGRLLLRCQLYIYWMRTTINTHFKLYISYA